jgi:hypothetical protein
LEVRRYGDGHPPVTKREREIRLNGISGVTFQKPGSRDFDPGFFIQASASKSGWLKNFTLAFQWI